LLAIAANPPLLARRFCRREKNRRAKAKFGFAPRLFRKTLKSRKISSQPLIARRLMRNGLSTLKIRVKRRLSI
jgi:hypothetical protein